jgi:hypothetical protein
VVIGTSVEVGLALKAGQAPYDLRRGERVQLIHVPGRGSEEPALVVDAFDATRDPNPHLSYRRARTLDGISDDERTVVGSEGGVPEQYHCA